MKKTNNILLAEQYLKAAFNHESIFKYRIEHSYRVAHIAYEIGKKEQLDEEGLYIAGLLHDISYSEKMTTQKQVIDHGRRSAEMIRNLVMNMDLSEQIKKDILFSIAIHEDNQSDFEGERNLFTSTIMEADNIDKLDVIRIVEMLERDGYHNFSLNQQKEYVHHKLIMMSQFYQFSFDTPTSTKMWKERIAFQLMFYQRLKDQLDKSDSNE